MSTNKGPNEPTNKEPSQPTNKGSNICQPIRDLIYANQ